MDDEGNNIFILVLDDNFIVGSDIVGILHTNGYSNVHLVSNCDDALKLIEQDLVEAAVLDVRLSGGETTEPVGHALLAKKTPFMFLTGYAGHKDLVSPDFADVRVQAKPYREADLVAGVQQLVSDRITISKD